MYNWRKYLSIFSCFLILFNQENQVKKDEARCRLLLEAFYIFLIYCNKEAVVTYFNVFVIMRWFKQSIYMVPRQ